MAGSARQAREFQRSFRFVGVQAVVAWGLVVLIGGAAGLLAMLICNYLLSFGGKIRLASTGSLQLTRLAWVESQSCYTC